MCHRRPARNDHQEEKYSMRLATLTAAALLSLASTLLIAVPARAQYGAIAWDEGSGKYGASWDKESPQRAAEAAIAECGATGCKVIIRPGRRECAALATTENGKYAGGAARKDRDTARIAALANCKKGKAGECTVRVTDCNK
jgi:hypothetical protein